jgi:hypothetical protein
MGVCKRLSRPYGHRTFTMPPVKDGSALRAGLIPDHAGYRMQLLRIEGPGR